MLNTGKPQTTCLLCAARTQHFGNWQCLPLCYVPERLMTTAESMQIHIHTKTQHLENYWFLSWILDKKCTQNRCEDQAFLGKTWTSTTARIWVKPTSTDTARIWGKLTAQERNKLQKLPNYHHCKSTRKTNSRKPQHMCTQSMQFLRGLANCYIIRFNSEMDKLNIQHNHW
jgi:hypothetical protein